MTAGITHDADTVALEEESPIPIRLAATLITVGIVLYDKATGEITQAMRAAPEAAAMLVTDKVGMCEIEGEAPQLSGTAGWDFIQAHHVDTRGFHPKVVEKAPCPARLDGHTLRDLPLPCQILITRPGDDPTTYDEDTDRVVTIDFDHVGEYTVRVLSRGFLPGTFTATVTEISHG